VKYKRWGLMLVAGLGVLSLSGVGWWFSSRGLKTETEAAKPVKIAPPQKKPDLPFSYVKEDTRYFEDFHKEHTDRGFILFGNFDLGMPNQEVANQCFWLAFEHAYGALQIVIVESPLGSRATSGPDARNPGKLCYIA
jgi:hypothetical protein